jgi:cytochrome c553
MKRMLAFIAACQAQAAPPGRRVIKEDMRNQMAAAVDLQRAVTTGRLSEVKDLAGWLATDSTIELAGWAPYLEELQYAARRIQSAGDVKTAGGELSRLGRACSACHEAERTKIKFAPSTLPPAGTTVVDQSRRQQWAAERLWEGVIGPSDARWAQGARVLATTHLDVRQFMHDKPNVEVVTLAERMRDLGQRLGDVHDSDARATFYGEMMATCAGCHAIVRTRPVASEPRVSARKRKLIR